MRNDMIQVRADWDPEARVYVATSEDVPGLVTEAATLEALEVKLAEMIPDLLAMNGGTAHGGFREVPLDLVVHHSGSVRIPA